MVEAGEECRESLAGAGGSDEQDALARSDDGPGKPLWGGWGFELASEPGVDGGQEGRLSCRIGPVQGRAPGGAGACRGSR